MASIVVVGGALPGLAAAARLARAGHDVTVVERRDRLGGRLADPGVWAPVLTFPAPLRDLFRTSGRALDAELAHRGLRMLPAPPAVHRFADGTELEWPTDRAAQWHLLHERYSPGVATHWRDTLDDLDETWQLLRPLGLEAELVDRSQISTRRRLDARRTIDDLARHVAHPHLSELVCDVAWRIGSDPRETPAWLASRLSVERTFGRWCLTDAAGAVQPAAVLLDALADRLEIRGVRVLTRTRVLRIDARSVLTDAGDLRADAVVSTVDPWQHLRLAAVTDLAVRAGAAITAPALAPRVSVAHAPTPEPFRELVLHTPTGPVITYTRPVPAGSEVVVHDHPSAVPAPGAGVRWRGPRTWLRMPGVRSAHDPRLFVASAASRGGNEPWAQLLTGALAAYAAHEALTGEDLRPGRRSSSP